MTAICLGVPLRFLAFEWREHWEYDHPSVLLEPVFRYSPNGTPIENIIEDAVIDICLALESGEDIQRTMHAAERKEFRWRRWSLRAMRKAAESQLSGRKVAIGTGYTRVLEQIYKLKQDGEVSGVLLSERQA